jgi:hypothetical protein
MRAVASLVRRRPLSLLRLGKGSFASRAVTTNASAETWCRHCHITFAQPDQLAHHAQFHCFPESPETVLSLFPSGSAVRDVVSGEEGAVLGQSGNPKWAHSSVSVLYVSPFSFLCLPFLALFALT